MNHLSTAIHQSLSVVLAVLICNPSCLAEPVAIACPTDTSVIWTECNGSLVKDGNKYTGEFLNNLFHGKGEYFFVGGDYYNGTFRQGLPDGWGVYVFMSDDKLKGDRYAGDFSLGQAQGRGSTFFHTGAVYSGHYAAGLPEGLGIYIDRDGSLVREGVWRAGKFVTAARVTFHSAEEVVRQTEQQLYLKHMEIENLNQRIKEQQSGLAEQEKQLSQLLQSIQSLENKHVQQLQSLTTLHQEKIYEWESSLAAQKNAEAQLLLELDQLKNAMTVETNPPQAQANLKPDTLDTKPVLTSKPLVLKKKAETKTAPKSATPSIDPMKDTFLYLQ